MIERLKTKFRKFLCKVFGHKMTGPYTDWGSDPPGLYFECDRCEEKNYIT